MSRPPVPVASVLAALTLLVAACGGGTADAGPGEDSGTTANDGATSTTAENATAGTTTSGTTTGEEQQTEATEPGQEDAGADVVIAGSLAGGEVLVDDRRFDVPLGSTVRIDFESDEVEHLHLHGYDLLVDLDPGRPAQLSFVADSPGSFEVELEDSGRFLFELLVR